MSATFTPETIAKGNLRFVSPHPVLSEVARDLARCVTSDDALALPVDIWMGAHKRWPFERETGRRVLAIQAEQIFDADGRDMWRRIRRKHLLGMARRADLMLDLSVHNCPAYGIWPRLFPRRFLFGPHVFPSAPPARRPGEGVVFYGTANDRRAALLAERPAIRALPRDTFGAALAREVAAAAAVANLHFSDGRYTEVPRLLSAYLAGKPLISENLAAPFEPGQHYVPLDAPLHDAALDRAFEGLTRLAAAYRFEDVLRRLA